MSELKQRKLRSKRTKPTVVKPSTPQQTAVGSQEPSSAGVSTLLNVMAGFNRLNANEKNEFVKFVISFASTAVCNQTGPVTSPENRENLPIPETKQKRKEKGAEAKAAHAIAEPGAGSTRTLKRAIQKTESRIAKMAPGPERTALEEKSARLKTRFETAKSANAKRSGSLSESKALAHSGPVGGSSASTSSTKSSTSSTSSGAGTSSSKE